MYILLLLILPAARTLAFVPPTIPTRVQKQPFSAVQFVQHKPIKKGPILFPNDAPPPPPTPLIVTSRPLSESIARSELNPNNTEPAQSEYHQVSFKPEYLIRSKSYQPYAYSVATATPVYDFGPTIPPYTGPVRNYQGNRNDKYYENDYEKHLMRNIHRREENLNRPQHLWDQPIRRQRIQRPRSRQHDRRAMYEDIDSKSAQIKVYHKSLYSREADYVNENKDDYNVYDDDQDEETVRPQRSIYGMQNRRTVTHNTPELPTYYNSRRNKRKNRSPHRRQYISENIVRNIQQRPNVRLDKILENEQGYKINKPTSVTGNQIKMNHRNILRNRDSEEDISNNQNYINDLPKRTITKLRKDKRLFYSGEAEFHRNDDEMTRINHPIAELSDINERPFKRPKLNNDRIVKLSKRRPIKSIEYEDNIDKLIALPTANIPPKPKRLRKIIKKEFSENFGQNYEKILNEGTLLSTEHLDRKILSRSFSKSDDKHIEEQEYMAKKYVTPFFALTEDIHSIPDSSVKPGPSKNQQRFQTQTRYYITTEQSPEPPHYTSNDNRHDDSKEINHGENYAFSYTVKDQKTGDDFSHSQHSTGSATNGEYRVRLPDGRMQIVSYTADENGYKADVRYDEQHNRENSIDVGPTREHHYHNEDVHLKADHGLNYDDNLDNKDSLENRDYIQKKFKVYDKLATISQKPNYSAIKNFYIDHKIDDIAHKNDYNVKRVNVDTTKVQVNEHQDDGLTDYNNDYLSHYNEKQFGNLAKTRDEDYYQFTEEANLSKEIMDYSSEAAQGYQPHKSKFGSFDKAKLTPSYDELKEIFVTNPQSRRQNAPIPVVSTVRPNYGTQENVVIITPKPPNLYTDIKDIATASPIPYSTPSVSTPRSYLFSTIANLKHQISLAKKPVLSHQYINKINKYLQYK